MSPRGVAIPDLRERLFDAAERVLARDGAAALTSRAVTEEAGCAKGVLHTHFAGLDQFVAELCLDRFARAAAQAEGLPGRAGTATVADNLAAVAAALLSLDPAVVELAVTRTAATLRIREAWRAGAPGLGVVQRSIDAYLREEQRLARVPRHTDTASVALALVGTLHHLLMTGWMAAADPQDEVERLIRTLVGGA
ncbi:TetR/AcrR family transcriptional regulator [Streptomyces spectabilis]|uniref:AcrR family transcriptional regulator n=1 Tax=Streptomyces spectabilis TaxID=68270 RepID=A0A5P2X542_STRST|nr:TetR/AcrR family transcriptional regulator [Streptomyces spectabilis]MBB5101407.1 AcrR family transcriptional regulator [Streptomyces spectabilis]MCI3900602.1 TetR/AcrR family transcriptional regulator [Streptomyces spectabilis]QEV58160.1 TetR/AcrR family transcriptional regulator [Streptomyces spectabilis]GGV11206.1 TetR family transcriptional regulator [Streptomyces spectabilis]